MEVDAKTSTHRTQAQAPQPQETQAEDADAPAFSTLENTHNIAHLKHNVVFPDAKKVVGISSDELTDLCRLPKR